MLADCNRDPMRALQSAVTSLRAQRAGKSKHPFCAATAGGSKDVLTQSSLFSVGGSVKGYSIIIQGNIRSDIMNFLLLMGYKVKRVGG